MARILFGATASLALAVALAGGAMSARADDPLDTSKLPRVDGSKVVFASAPTTIYTATDRVAVITDAVVKVFAADGWQTYVAPLTEVSKSPNSEFRSFKKGGLAVKVSVSLAPAQGNATTVNYIAEPLAYDLPFPNDASDIQYDPHRPYLICVTSGTIDDTFKYFKKELSGRGWEYQPAVTGNGKYKSPDAENAYFARKGYPSLLLLAQRAADGRTMVDLKGEPAADVAAQVKGDEERAAKIADEIKSAPEHDSIDLLAGDVLKRVDKIVADAKAEAESGGGASADASPVIAADDKSPPVSAKLGELEGNTAPIPLPETATDVEFKGDVGTLSFTAQSSVKAIAGFYHSVMRPLGWAMKPSIIDRPNMVMVEFSKGDKDLAVTIMQHGHAVGVSANGSALEAADANPEVAGESEADANTPPAAPEPEKELVAEEMSGLPVPTDHTFSTGGSGAFRNDLSANVTARLDAVLAFYRRELTKRSWKELDGAVIKTDHAELAFKTPDGPAALKLNRKDGGTIVALYVRHTTEAAKAGLLPKAGQAKILLGNFLHSDCVITINKQTIQIKAGAGTKGPDGPLVEVPPGDYTFTTESAGKLTKVDRVEVAADDIWGIMIGPGGALSLQMY